MDKQSGPGTSPLPLSSLRLLCSPVRLLSGAIWRTVQQNAVSDYGMLGEFVSMVTDTVPELLTSEQKTQLLMGLRSQTGFPEEFCPRYDESLVTVTWQFLSRLEKLFPLQTIQQVAVMLTDIPSTLEECLKSVSHQDELQTLLGCRKDLLNENGGPLEGAHVTSALPHVHAYGSSTAGQHANPVTAAVSEEMQMMTVENVAKVGTRHQESMDAFERNSVLLKKLDAVPSVQRWLVRSNRGLKRKRILLQEKNARRKMPSKQILARTQTLALEPSTPSILSCTQDPFPSVTYTITADDDDEEDSINSLDDPSYMAPVGSASEDESLSDCSNKHHSCTELASPRDGKMVCLKKKDIPKIELLAANTTSMNKDLCFICNTHVQTDMKEHMKDHFPDGVLTCPRCHKIFKTIASLKRHFKMVCIEQLQLEPGRSEEQDAPQRRHAATTKVNSSTQGRQCFICKKNVQTDMKEHMKDHFPDGVLTCPQCGTLFKNMQSLRLHFKRVCIEQLQLEPGEARVGQGLLKCDECEKSYRYKLSLDKHKLTHNQLYCEVCRRVMRDAQTLARHKASHTPFQCTLCEKHFVVFKHLSRHYENAHKPSKPYKCHHCPKVFSELRFFIRHEWKHTGQLPFQCSQCSKKFKQDADLVVHQRVHTNEKPYLCADCGKGFSSNSNRTRHKGLVHGKSREVQRFSSSQRKKRQKKQSHGPCKYCGTVLHSSRLCPQVLLPGNASNLPLTSEMTTMDGAHVEANDGDSVSLLQDPSCLAPIDSSSKDNTLHNDSNDNLYFTPNDQKDFSVASEEQDTPQRRHAATTKVNSSTQGRQCFICNKNVQTDMKEHMKDHFPDGVLTCPQCGTLFKNMQSLRLHFKRVCFEQLQLEPGEARVGQGLLKCDKCERSYRYKLSLDKHKRTHNQLYCEVCRRVMRDAQTLARHKASHTPFQCTLCEKHFVVFQHLSRHYENAHKPSKPYKCHHCPKVFSKLRFFIRHEWKHTGQLPFQCSQCSKKFKQDTDLVVHLRVHTHEKPFLCADCGKTFSSSSNLRRHVNFRHGKFRDARRFPCPRCDKTFQEKGGLQKHEQRAHRNQKKMCHPCVDCGKMFSQSGMARHKLTHTGEKPLKCQMPDCEWRFRSASEVKSHVLRHHSAERPFECNTCGKGFIRASVLNDHIKIHSGEKEHVCLVCGKAFVKLYGMNRHMQLMHTSK